MASNLCISNHQPFFRKDGWLIYKHSGHANITMPIILPIIYIWIITLYKIGRSSADLDGRTSKIDKFDILGHVEYNAKLS